MKNLLLAASCITLATSALADSLAVSPGMNVVGTPQFIYCELQGSTPRYGFEDGKRKGTTYTYSGGAINLSAYLNTRLLSDAPRGPNDQFDNVNQSHTLRLSAFFQPSKGHQESFGVQATVGEDLFGGGTNLTFYVNPEIDGQKVPQVSKQVLLKDLKDFRIDFAGAEFHLPSATASTWVDEQGRPTYTLELHCRTY
jgi:hypothetical protein